jgi:hypothetical protein
MVDDPGNSASRQSSSVYPILDSASRADIADDLLQIVVRRHGGQVSDGQLTELKAVIEAQLADTEKLHAFALSNADEPAFVMPATYGGHR